MRELQVKSQNFDIWLLYYITFDISQNNFLAILGLICKFATSTDFFGIVVKDFYFEGGQNWRKLTSVQLCRTPYWRYILKNFFGITTFQILWRFYEFLIAFSEVGSKIKTNYISLCILKTYSDYS